MARVFNYEPGVRTPLDVYTGVIPEFGSDAEIWDLIREHMINVETPEVKWNPQSLMTIPFPNKSPVKPDNKIPPNGTGKGIGTGSGTGIGTGSGTGFVTGSGTGVGTGTGTGIGDGDSNKTGSGDKGTGSVVTSNTAIDQGLLTALSQAEREAEEAERQRQIDEKLAEDAAAEEERLAELKRLQDAKEQQDLLDQKRLQEQNEIARLQQEEADKALQRLSDLQKSSPVQEWVNPDMTGYTSTEVDSVIDQYLEELERQEDLAAQALQDEITRKLAKEAYDKRNEEEERRREEEAQANANALALSDAFDLTFETDIASAGGGDAGGGTGVVPAYTVDLNAWVNPDQSTFVDPVFVEEDPWWKRIFSR